MPAPFQGFSLPRLRAAHTLLALTLASAAVLAAPAVTQSASAAPSFCSAFDQPVYQRINPKNGAQLITLNATEATQAGAKYGYSDNVGVAFKASRSGRGTVAVHRLSRSKPTDAVWTASTSEITRLKKSGYADQGGNFLAATTADSCLVGVTALTRSGMHRQSADPATVSALLRAGWVSAGISFYVAPAKTTQPSAPVTTKPVTEPGLPTGPTGLDVTGRTIPDTNYPIPSGAIFIDPNGNDAKAGTRSAPVRTVNRAIDLAPRNGTVVFRGGVYRDAYRTKSGSGYAIISKGLTLQAYPHESPWLDGSDAVPASRWTSDGHGHWSTAWSTPDFCGDHYYQAAPNSTKTACTYPDMIHGSATNPIPADPQQAFVNGTPFHQTDTLAKVTGSNFFYDWSARRLYVGANPSSHTIELSKRPMALVLAGTSRNSVLGLGFRRFASYPREGVNAAVYVGGFATVKNSAFVDNAGIGLSFSLRAEPSSVVHSVFIGNGFTGLAANGTSEHSGVPTDRFLVQDNAFVRNNAEETGIGCTVSCGQAAVKLAHMRGYTITGNLVQQTGGGAVGLWCDLDCSGGVYTNNVVRDQPKSSGIFVEVGDTTIVANNLITGNLYGISVASATTKIYNNTLVDNVQAIRIYDDHRSRGKNWGGKVWLDVGPDTTGVQIGNNLAYSTSYSIIAFPMTPGSVAPNTGAERFFTSIDHNAFFQASATHPTFVKLTTLAGSIDSYKTKAAFGAATGFAQNSVWISGVDPFVDRAGGDYRLKSQYAAMLKTAPMPADVASALGLKAGTTVLAGAARR